MENNHWVETTEALSKIYTFKTFEDAMRWMQESALYISKIDHHPEWRNIYNKIWVKLTTHDAGNTVTNKDRELAMYFDQLYMTKFSS